MDRVTIVLEKGYGPHLDHLESWPEQKPVCAVMSTIEQDSD